MPLSPPLPQNTQRRRMQARTKFHHHPTKITHTNKHQRNPPQSRPQRNTNSHNTSTKSSSSPHQRHQLHPTRRITQPSRTRKPPHRNHEIQNPILIRKRGQRTLSTKHTKPTHHTSHRNRPKPTQPTPIPMPKQQQPTTHHSLKQHRYLSTQRRQPQRRNRKFPRLSKRNPNHTNTNQVQHDQRQNHNRTRHTQNSQTHHNPSKRRTRSLPRILYPPNNRQRLPIQQSNTKPTQKSHKQSKQAHPTPQKTTNPSLPSKGTYHVAPSRPPTHSHITTAPTTLTLLTRVITSRKPIVFRLSNKYYSKSSPVYCTINTFQLNRHSILLNRINTTPFCANNTRTTT